MGSAYERPTQHLYLVGKDTTKQTTKQPRFGILFNKGAIWLGGHYSPFNRRWCINLVPCVTIWFTLRDGKAPQRAKF